jgi:hypothetical protein
VPISSDASSSVVPMKSNERHASVSAKECSLIPEGGGAVTGKGLHNSHSSVHIDCDQTGDDVQETLTILLSHLLIHTPSFTSLVHTQASTPPSSTASPSPSSTHSILGCPWRGCSSMIHPSPSHRAIHTLSFTHAHSHPLITTNHSHTLASLLHT